MRSSSAGQLAAEAGERGHPLEPDSEGVLDVRGLHLPGMELHLGRIEILLQGNVERRTVQLVDEEPGQVGARTRDAGQDVKIQIFGRKIHFAVAIADELAAVEMHVADVDHSALRAELTES